MNKPEINQKPRFATVYGTPGNAPRTKGPLKVFWPLIPIFITTGWLLHAALPVPQISTSVAGFLLFLLAMVLALFTIWSAKRLKSFIKGAEGEETVARTLSYLPASHTVFNDLHLDDKGPTFDHIVVAPAGVFVIETKNWSGEITFENGHVFCNGKKATRPPLKQVKEAANALLGYLSATQCPEVEVHPILCFVNNVIPSGIINIGGVRICSDHDLHQLFENTLETPLPRGTLSMINDELKRCMEQK